MESLVSRSFLEEINTAMPTGFQGYLGYLGLLSRLSQEKRFRVQGSGFWALGFGISKLIADS